MTLVAIVREFKPRPDKRGDDEEEVGGLSKKIKGVDLGGGVPGFFG